MASKNTNVILKVKAGHVVAVPHKLSVHIGDTVTFNSKEPVFKVEFEERWPFAGKEHIVRDNRPLTFASEGPFTFLCYTGTRTKMYGAPSSGHSRSGRIKWVSYKGAGGTGSVKPPGK
jgi:hypothetical protein